MAERYPYHAGGQTQQQPTHMGFGPMGTYGTRDTAAWNQQPLGQRVAKIVGATTAGGSMMVLSGLTLVATVIGLTLVTPILVIFSPVLVPAAIAIFLICAGFLGSGGLGVAALSVISWLYRYVTGKHPVGADQLEQARATLAGKARDIKDTVGHKIDQVTST